jgi:hypothetical protein
MTTSSADAATAAPDADAIRVGIGSVADRRATPWACDGGGQGVAPSPRPGAVREARG